MDIDIIHQRIQDYYSRPEHYQSRNQDIAEMASVRGGGVRAAEKYGITRQRVSQILQASMTRK